MRLKKIMAAAIFIATILSASTYPFVLAAETENSSVSATSGIYDTQSGYANYLQTHPVKYTNERIEIQSLDFANGEEVKQNWDDDVDRQVLHTSQNSKVSWNFEVKKAGSYAIHVKYKPLDGTNGIIKRSVALDGKIPFDEARTVPFLRVFEDAQSIKQDLQGNDIRPTQKEIKKWDVASIRDIQGYFGNKLYFWLEAGKHSLAFNALQEPMAIDLIVIESKKDLSLTYKEKLTQWKSQGIQTISGVLEKGLLEIEAENSYQKSSQAAYPINDSSSANTSPQSADRQKLNCIGGTRWQDAGEWISWKIDVPKSGLYHIGFRFLQNFERDTVVGRKLTIDGEIQFVESSQLSFYYDGKFQKDLARGQEPYLFYLEKGSREIRLEVMPGELSELLVDISTALDELNNANWQLLTLLGSSPDLYKSYFIDEALPQTLEVMVAQGENIEKLAKRWEAMTGQSGSNVSQLKQLAFKLKRMTDEPNRIPSMYETFKDDLGALGDMLAVAKAQPLLLDTIFISEKGASVPKANSSFLGSFKYEMQRLFSSYFNDYNTIGTADNKNEKSPITVWIGTGITGGRDQALALNQLTIQDFSAKNNIPVNLQLVPGGTILTATLAGMGPDLALSLPSGDPVNYAMRGAVADLSKMENYNNVISRFPVASYRAFEYLEGTYALPETLSFPMMFYRRDILENLGIDPEQLKTWQDIVDVLPLIQRNNMNFALPANFNTYVMFLFQNNNELYIDNNRKTGLDSKGALNAFDEYVKFYSQYTTPYAYSFEMRFRTGEIPLGIADYTTYNLLQISAPEIQGKWEMRPVPGIRQDDGEINRTAPASGSGCVIMSASQHKKESWEFLKWWTDTDCQVSFGRELESVMGPAARYNTANIEAIESIPWQAVDRDNLMMQISHLEGIPEVPGGYMTSRSVDFAIRKVYNQNAEARSTLLSYISQINQEIEIKREEFGLD